MDFFASQDRARASTRRLIFFYVLALIGVVVSLNVVAVLVYGAGTNAREQARDRYDRAVQTGPDWGAAASNLGVYATTTVSVLTLVALATMFKQMQIGGDGVKVAELLGGREITSTPDDLDERKYVNVVEEMSLASGVPKPRLFVMDDEHAINAFAAGTQPGSAVVSVTRGTLQKLNRDELQGVVAHEFSHILNGDMRLNVRLITLNFGIMAIGYIGLQILRFAPHRSSGRKNDNSAAAVFVIGIAMMIIGYVGTVFGKMLQAAVSRQREYLADASAVQFTRNPNGIAGALKKIGGFSSGSKLATPHAGEASHMFFGEGVGGFLDSIFATHPPLPDRIRAIEPSFDGVFPTAIADTAPLEGAAALSGFARAPATFPGAGERIAAKPGDLRGARTTIEPQSLAFGVETLEALPDRLLEAARDPYESRAVALALLLDREPSLRDAQLQILAGADQRIAELAAAFWPIVNEVGPAARLPLLELSIPALRQMSPTQAAQFRSLCQACVEADQQISPFELAVSRVLEQLPSDQPSSRSAAKYRSISAVREPAAIILSTLASAGGEEQADAAFNIAVERLGLSSMTSRKTGYDPHELAHALDALRDSTPAVQQRVVDAAAHCVAADRVVRIEEIELMRVLCAAFNVPIPPFLQPV